MKDHSNLMQEHLDKLHRVLDPLGETTTEVADELIRMGIRGAPYNKFFNPIAVFLNTYHPDLVRIADVLSFAKDFPVIHRFLIHFYQGDFPSLEMDNWGSTVDRAEKEEHLDQVLEYWKAEMDSFKAVHMSPEALKALIDPLEAATKLLETSKNITSLFQTLENCTDNEVQFFIDFNQAIKNFYLAIKLPTAND